MAKILKVQVMGWYEYQCHKKLKIKNIKKQGISHEDKRI